MLVEIIVSRRTPLFDEVGGEGYGIVVVVVIVSN